MKKYLLPIVLLAGTGILPLSANTVVHELTAETFGSPASETTKTYAPGDETGITYFAGIKAVDGQMVTGKFSFSKKYGIKVQGNTGDYQLKSVNVEWGTSAPETTTANLYANPNGAYTGTSFTSTMGVNTALTYEKSSVSYTDKYVAFQLNNSSTTIYIKKITVTWSDGKDGEKENPTLNFPESYVSATIGQSFVSQTITGEKHGPLSYSSSDSSVATVNSSTGAVTLVGQGIATITVNSAENETYTAGEASYTLEVLPALADGQYYGGLYGFQQKVDWTFNNNISDMAGSVWRWTTSADGNYMRGYGASSSGIKWYADAMTISQPIEIPEDLKGAQVTFDAAFSGYPSVDEVPSYCKIQVAEFLRNENVGDAADPKYEDIYSDFKPSGVVVAASNDGVWTTCAVDLSAYVGKKIKVGFNYISTKDVAGEWKFRNVKVMKADGPIVVKKEPDISFAKSEVSVDEGAAFSAPMLLNPYSISGITYASSVPEVAAVDASTGKVTVVKYGTTTITANSPETDEYFAGAASYVLTVLPTAQNAAAFANYPENLNVKANFTATAVYVHNNYNYIVDGSGNAALIYGKLSGINKGDVIASGWSGSNKVYNGLTEIVPAAADQITTTGKTVDVVYETVTPDFLTAANVNKVVSLSNVTFAAATPADNKSFTGVCDGREVTFFNSMRVASVEAGAYDVDIAVSIYSKDGETTIQAYPLEYREYIAPVYVSASYKGTLLQDNQGISAYEGDEVKVDFSCTEGADVYYTFTPASSQTPGAETELGQSGSVTFTESGVVTYYAKNAKTQSDTYTLNLTFLEIPLSITASYNGTIIADGMTVESVPGAILAPVTFSFAPEDAVAYYSFTETADEDPEYMKVPADGTVNFNNSGYVRYYAERNGKQTEVYSFTLKMSEELPIGPLHIAAYFNDTLIPDRGTISANAGEDFCEVTFVCEEPQAELYYCFYTYEENEGAFKPVPEDGIVVFRENGTVKYFAATDEFASQSYSFNVDVTTGVGAVTVARDSEAVFYDLQGRRVSGQLLPGIYVEVKNGKAVKRIIR